MRKHRIAYIMLFVLISLSISGFQSLPQNATSPLSKHASIAAAPAPFGKVSPSDGAVDQPTSGLTLQWTASGPGVAYQYCLRTNKRACPRSKWISVGANTSVTLQGLTANTTYYWQVRAVDASNTYTYADSMWWQFKTVANPNLPGGFTKLAPEDALTNQPVNGLELRWTASNLATSYEYCYDTLNNNVCDTSWTSVNILSAVVGGLAYDTNYYWQVRAVNASGNVQADFGTWFSFRTQLAPSGEFRKISPQDQSAGQPLNLTLTWGASSGTGVTYEYCIGAAPCTPASAWIPAGNNLFANPNTLQYGTTYYWQVRAKNTTATVYANDGTSWSFTTLIAPPQDFGKTSPGDNLTGQPLSLVLTWEASAGANIHYEYCIDDTACTPDGSTWMLAGTSTSANISGLSFGTPYYWQVRAVNSSGTTYADGGAVWSFTTRDAPPQVFSKLNPAAASPDRVPVNLSLQWSPSGGASEYYYCVDTTSHPANDTACNTGWVLNTTTESVHLDLLYNHTYYWQVYAENEQGTLQANNGAWWSFTTIEQAPAAFTKVSPFNGTVDKPVKPWLYWWTPSTPGTTKYDYCIYTAASCPNGGWNSVTENAPIPPPDGLAYNTTYYWQVRATRGGNTVEANDIWWSFTTLKAPPTSSNQAFSTDENKSITRTLAAVSNYEKFFSLYGSLPEGTLNFQSDGSFTYTPVAYFNGTVSFQFVLSDAHNAPIGPYTVTITVNPLNNPPVLSSIPNLSVKNGKQATFWAQASDPDLPYGEQLAYSIDEALPAGASIDPETGLFTWPKAVYKGTGVLTLTVRVTDQGGLSDTQTVVIVVAKPKIYIPVIIR